MVIENDFQFHIHKVCFEELFRKAFRYRRLRRVKAKFCLKARSDDFQFYKSGSGFQDNIKRAFAFIQLRILFSVCRNGVCSGSFGADFDERFAGRRDR
jgi:hypothetical protein